VFVYAAIVFVKRQVLRPVQVTAGTEQRVHALFEAGWDHQI
jgi:hypothetical protein